MTAWWSGWQETSGHVWNLICEKFPPSHEHREVFQLLAAAYIYHLNGVRELHEFSDERLHQVLVSGRYDKQWDTHPFARLFDSSRAPLFSDRVGDKGEMEYFGSMHLSSASFRLSTALTLATRLAVPSLIPFIGNIDWNRKCLVSSLGHAAALDCSEQFPLDPPDKLIAAYVAMIVAHRDEFGHGEIGDREGGWIGKRENAFRKFRCCRIIEAQLHLLKMGLAAVKRRGDGSIL